MTENEQALPNENPYASPGYIPIDAQANPAESVEENDIRAFVGQNKHYYVDKWRSSRRPSGAGFNWAAFFLGGLWLAYRKMYVAATIFYTFILLESVAGHVLFVVVLGKEDVPAGLGRAIGLGVALVCGASGNRWYLSHARKVISEVRARQMEDDAVADELSRRGGTSVGASLGFACLFVMGIFAAFAVLEFLFWS